MSIGRAPLTNFYESLIFYAWCIGLLLIVMKKRLGFPLMTAFASLIALAFMGYASFSPSVDKNIQPLVPALQSNWLHIHVFTCSSRTPRSPPPFWPLSFLSSILGKGSYLRRKPWRRSTIGASWSDSPC